MLCKMSIAWEILLSGCRYEENFVWGGVLEGAPAVDNTSLPEGDALRCLIFCAEKTTYFVLTPPNPYGKDWDLLNEYPDQYDDIDFEWWCWCTNEDSPKTELNGSFSGMTLCVQGTIPLQNTLDNVKSYTVRTILEYATSMINEKEYLVVLGGLQQSSKVHVIPLNESDPVPQCLMQLPKHPQTMEWSASVFGLCECSCSYK